MFRFLILSALLISTLCPPAFASQGTGRPSIMESQPSYPEFRKSEAVVDSIYVMGGPGDLTGKFEDEAGQPAWNGWTSVDLSSEAMWSVSGFNAADLDPSQPDNHAWW